MLDTSPLKVDFTQETDVLAILPRPPLLTSEKLDWTGLNAQYHCQPAWQSPEACHMQHVIVVVMHTPSATVQSTRTIAGNNQQEQLVAGICAIIPADAAHHSTWDGETGFLLLNLDPGYLAQIAHETVDSDRVELIPQFATLEPTISGIGFALKTELETGGAGGKLYAESATTLLATHLLQHYCTRSQTLPSYHAGGLPKYKLREAIAYIQDHLGEEITLEAIATHLNMSHYYFCHLFKQSMGVSPYQYVLQQRINKAKPLLKQRQLAITDVALECGFANQTHFTKYFRKLTGITPRAYREQ